MSLTTYLNPDVIKDGAISASKISAISKSITWSELKTLRDGSKLIPGMQYKITDYQCTTIQENTRSAGHVFDVIVTADDESTLNEEARAAKHEGDTYFANSDMNAWKIWYCLDNDTTRFKWADSTNGKGVIYRMIDEFNNDIPYDFKNIQFKHPNDTTTYPHYYYTFARDNVKDNTDCSLDIANNCYSNTIMENINENIRSLNQIVFIGSSCYSNSFDLNCHHDSFTASCFNNSFGLNFYNNSFLHVGANNTFGSNCHNNIFNSFNHDNVFGDGCTNNSFGMDCYSNLFGHEFHDNILGSDFKYNTFGIACSYIKFASDSSASTKYNYYQYNHFGDGCNNIIFTGAETASSEAQIQKYNFAQGLSNITVDGIRNRDFETKVEKDSNGNLKEFCLADLIWDENDNSYYYSASFIGDI